MSNNTRKAPTNKGAAANGVDSATDSTYTPRRPKLRLPEDMDEDLKEVNTKLYDTSYEVGVITKK